MRQERFDLAVVATETYVRAPAVLRLLGPAAWTQSAASPSCSCQRCRWSPGTGLTVRSAWCPSPSGFEQRRPHRPCLPIGVRVLPARRALVGLVRAGSARHWEPLVLGGHERSRWVCKNRTSYGIYRSDLARERSMGPGSSPPPSCREPSGLLPTRRWSPKTSLTLRSGGANRATEYQPHP
jgi:hypothetical protein